MKLSMILEYAGNPRAAADHAADLEKAGLDGVWVGEAYGFDSPSLMGYLAAKTESLEIGSAILNIYSRTPALLAQTAAGLDNVSAGRFALGLGASGPQVIEGWHAVPYEKPIGRMRDVVTIVRSALRREVLMHDGHLQIPLPQGMGAGLGKPLKMLTTPERAEVPVYIAALSKRSVEMTAEIADGWLPHLFAPDFARHVWGEAIAAGTSKRPIGLGRLEVVAGGAVAIGDDVKDALDSVRPMFALYIGGMGARNKNFYYDLACEYGFKRDAERIQDLYLSGNKRAAEAAVPLELLERTNLVGPESYVRERIAMFAEAGVTNLLVQPVGGDPVAVVRKMRELVDTSRHG